MIEDLDGPDPVPSRRGHMLVISVLLLAGVVAGYAAVSSPDLRGPYATPRPSVVNAPRVTPAPVGTLEPAAISVPFVRKCVPPNTIQVTRVVLGSTLIVYDQTGQTITAILPMSVTDVCAVIWGQTPSPIPLDRVSH